MYVCMIHRYGCTQSTVHVWWPENSYAESRLYFADRVILLVFN